MKFIHTADIHWGMIPDSDKPWGKKREQAIRLTFQGIIEDARDSRADLLLISGDLFHRQPLARDLKEVNYLFSTIPGTRVVIIAGNHDRIRKSSALLSFTWAPNVTFLMGEELSSVYFEELNTEVYGFSYHTAEIIGGSQREDDYDKLLARMNELGLKPEDYGFYLDLRKYGSVRHSGFGLGFERCVMYLTGMGNIRDVIPFPRTVNNCEL